MFIYRDINLIFGVLAFHDLLINNAKNKIFSKVNTYGIIDTLMVLNVGLIKKLRIEFFGQIKVFCLLTYQLEIWCTYVSLPPD